MLGVDSDNGYRALGRLLIAYSWKKDDGISFKNAQSFGRNVTNESDAYEIFGTLGEFDTNS